MVCMPGEPAYPVLAVCPPTPPTDATAGADNAAGRRRNNQHRQSSPSSTEPQKARPKTPAEAVVVDENPPIGFLLKWQTPKKRALTAPAVDGAEGESLLTNPSAADVITTGEESESAQAKEGEQNGRRYYGRRGHYRGGGKVGTYASCLRYCIDLLVGNSSPSKSTCSNRWCARATSFDASSRLHAQAPPPLCPMQPPHVGPGDYRAWIPV